MYHLHRFVQHLFFCSGVIFFYEYTPSMYDKTCELFFFRFLLSISSMNRMTAFKSITLMSPLVFTIAGSWLSKIIFRILSITNTWFSFVVLPIVLDFLPSTYVYVCHFLASECPILARTTQNSWPYRLCRGWAWPLRSHRRSLCWSVCCSDDLRSSSGRDDPACPATKRRRDPCSRRTYGSSACRSKSSTPSHRHAPSWSM